MTQRRVPFHKDGKKLRFLKSEIDNWLRGSYHQTDEELYDEGLRYVNNKREGGR